jgi:SAM-dependent methyltransferase
MRNSSRSCACRQAKPSSTMKTLDTIDCPYCAQQDHSTWAEEAGYCTVRCNSCSLIFVNPRPSVAAIEATVRSGLHQIGPRKVSVVGRRSSRNIAKYQRILARMFDDTWRRGRPVSWLDVGAGYGEVVEAVTALAPTGSCIEGIEPMKAKASAAQARGLPVTEGYLSRSHDKVEFISLVNIFSHLPNFAVFLQDVNNVLAPRGEIFVETGNLADLQSRSDFVGELGLPDHLVFAGESHVAGYLEQGGFEIIRLERVRDDGLLNVTKNTVKKLLGRPGTLRLPYTSRYRQLLVRARLRN